MSWRLECGLCERPVARGLATVCPDPDCGKPLLARYDLGALNGEALRRAWTGRQGGMWRFREIMPVEPNEDPVTLGEGGTPLLEIEIGEEFEGLTLMVKDEGLNPTGSFKDRGLCAAVTRAVHEGATDLVIPSAGNAGAALAAYAARAGVPSRLFIPEDTPEGVARRCEHYGADIVRVDGLIDVEREPVLDVEREEGADDTRKVADVARLERVAAAVHAEFRAGDAERAGDVLARPLEFDDEAGIAVVRRGRRALPRRAGGSGDEETGPGEQADPVGAGGHRSYTTRPPTTVRSTSIDSRHGSSHSSTWSAVTTRSAAIPTSSVPFSSSSKVRCAYALVAARSASLRVIASDGSSTPALIVPRVVKWCSIHHGSHGTTGESVAGDTGIPASR